MPGKKDSPWILASTLFFSAFQAKSEVILVYMAPPWPGSGVACTAGCFLFGYFLIACKCLKNGHLEFDPVLKVPATAEHGDTHAFDYSQARDR